MTFPRYASNFKVHFGFGCCFHDLGGFLFQILERNSKYLVTVFICVQWDLEYNATPIL